MYYTRDHEWIDFQGTGAYVGVSNFKLIGFREIDEVIFRETKSPMKKGDLVAWIRYKDYKIEILMPVDGSIVQINKIFLGNNLKQISTHLQKSGWIFSIIPTNYYHREDLIPIEEYMTLIRNEYPK
jgi:glycine cleavage system H protein